MRHILLLDDKITEQQYRAWMKEDKAFWKQWFGVDNKYWVIRTDFSSYETFMDNDGDVRPTNDYLVDLVKKSTKGYDKYGADFVMMVVHRDNWRSDSRPTPRIRRELLAQYGTINDKGIWGTNYSNIYNGYHLQYCRWDDNNLANVFGTMYHERHHAFDALVKTETGKDIRSAVPVSNWDADVTHGRHPSWEYIRHKENTAALQAIAPLMREALSNRLRLHIEYIQGRITLWQSLIRWLNEWRNKTNGVPRK